MSQSVHKARPNITSDLDGLEDARSRGDADDARPVRGAGGTFRKVVEDPRTSSPELDRAVLNFIDDLRRG
jgi:hypothetical protein